MKKHRARALMIQGTGSGVGKSVLVAAFGRIFKDMGLKVAPFKAQNMALNSCVTVDGLEMGRAQGYQAEACGLRPDVRMNPILLKPSADNSSQVILLGRTCDDNCKAVDYYSRYLKHRKIVEQAYDDLAAEYDVIVIEGAGSPAEINLQDRDLVNMQMAHYAGASVLIAGDIDRGGVFAWMKGTYDLIQDEYKSLVKGFLINKFRGDRALLEPGISMFGEIVKAPVLGVIPYFRDIQVDEEDAIPQHQVKELAQIRESGKFIESGQIDELTTEKMVIGVIVPPHISNFTDFTALSLEPDVSLHFLRSPVEADLCDALILPGSKATLADALQLSKQGWFQRLQSACARGVPVIGICGGYQMLGEKIFDPCGVESDLRQVEGMGLLPLTTTIEMRKIVKQVRCRTCASAVFPAGISVTGYEIHMGRTEITGRTEIPGCTQIPGTQVRGMVQPLFDAPLSDATGAALASGASLGVMAQDRPVLGTYIHGFFDEDQARRFFINWLRRRKGLPPYTGGFSYQRFRQEQLDRLAAVVREHCDLKRIVEFVTCGIMDWIFRTSS